MRFYKILTTILIALALCCNACKDKLFDFDLNNIEADAEWGIPVFKSTISVEELFEHLDSTGLLQVGSNGILKYVIEHDMEKAVVLKDIIHIENQLYDTSGVESVTHLPDFDLAQIVHFNLNTEDYIIKNCHVKNGILSIDFGFNNATFAYTATLVTNQIFDASNNPLSLQFSNTHQHEAIDLSNYHIVPDNFGNIQFDAHVVIPSVTDIDHITYICHAEIRNFDIHSATCQFKPISQELNARTKLAFNFDKLELNIFQLNNAVASLYAKNNICQVDGTINDMYLSGNNGAYSPLIQSVVNFSVPLSQNQYMHIVDANIPTLSYNPNLDSLGIRCMLNINPSGFSAGDIFVDENSEMDFKLQTELPVNISIDNAVYKDTIDNGLYQQLDPNSSRSIEQITLRVAYTNALPFNLIPSIIFLNSRTGQTYPLDLQGLQIHGCYNDTPYQQQPLFYELQSLAAQNIVTADKVIVSFRLTTDDNTVVIKDSQFIRANIGAKIKYSNINL